MKRYEQSERLLLEAEKLIPLGSQTFSKSQMSLPLGAAPMFLERARGSKTWDVDGNEFIDLVNSLLAVSLGHCDPDVDAAVINQLRSGVSLSMPHLLEQQVAEKIVSSVPCAEMVRYGKNGSDATAAAVRIARAYTGRDRVVVCGYHGWHDWSIGTTSRSSGVPAATRRLTQTFQYNDIGSLHAALSNFDGEVAAVIMEPMSFTWPEPGFLREVAELTRASGAVLVFDETITGFRFGLGGAQELFGVTPDLATFGKGVGNGFPISVLTGSKDLMAVMDRIFFSTTFGGETLSLAASNAVLGKMLQRPVLEHVHEIGERLARGTLERVTAHGLADRIGVVGHPSWSSLTFTAGDDVPAQDLKTLFLQEVIRRGVLTAGSHNVSWAMSDTDVEFVLAAYDDALDVVQDALKVGNVTDRMECAPLQSVFAVRPPAPAVEA